MTALSSAVRSRVVHRARSGNSPVVWVNVRRGHPRSAQTSLGFTTITSSRPACGTSLTPCRHHAWTPLRDHSALRTVVGDDISPHDHPSTTQGEVDRIDHVIVGQVEDHARSVTLQARTLGHSSWSLSGWMSRNTHPSARPRAPASPTHHAQLRVARIWIAPSGVYAAQSRRPAARAA